MLASNQARLLIVDDGAPQMKALCETLQQEGYATAGFTSAGEALHALRGQEFDVLLTDLMMPEMDGISLLRAAFEIDRTVVGIIMTGHGTVEAAVEAMKMGALDFVVKPLTLRSVLPVISRALTVRRLRLENIQLLETVAIYELSVSIEFVQDSQTTLQKTADAAFQHGDANDVSILLPAPGGEELFVAAACGQNARNVEGTRLPMTNEISNWLGQTHQTVSGSEEIADTPLVFPQPPPAIGSGVSIPMVAAGKLVGILNVTPARPHRPIPLGRIKTLKILAGTAASALHAASLLQELRSAEQRYRRLAENAPDVVFRYELLPERRYSYMSPSVTAVCGYAPEDFYADPNLGIKIAHPEDRPLLEARLEAALRGDVSEGTTTIRLTTCGGDTVWVEQRHVLVRDDSGRVTAIEGISRDVTERRNLEEQLRHSQRMEGMGHLAGGVAHDFNNLLTVINGYGDLLLSKLPAGDASRDSIQEIRNAADRAAQLTRQLLAFSRKQLLQPRVIDLNELVENHSKMLARLLGEDIELVTVLDPATGSIKADPGQLEQVVMNLAVNSRDAMPRGGKLTIETCNVMLDEGYAREHISVEPGPYVMLAVSDTGSGMDAETRTRIFEPFFTTKELGRGTGLGLSIVYGIIKQSGGNIWVYSELDKGTTFKIYFPRTQEQCGTAEAHPESKQAPKGSETILVAEDEPAVRQLICMILRGAGYKVLETHNGGEALEVFREHEQDIGLVLTDMIMPGLGGRPLAEKFEEIRPTVKVLYTSGYSDEVVVRHGHLDEGMPFIQKPFGSGDLLRMVRKTLDS